MGLHGLDSYAKGGTVPVGTWVTVAYVLTKNSSTQFTHQTYINGVAQGTATTSTYSTTVQDSPFGVGYNVTGLDRRYFTGDIASLRYDDVALGSAQLLSDSSNFLGLVPEPSTPLLGLLSVALLAFKRRR